MKIVITSQGKTLEDQLDPRFGRCKYLLIYDTKTGIYEVKDNTQNQDLNFGAGIKVGRLLIKKDADCVVTGKIGPKAFALLRSAGIKIYIGASGYIQDVIEKFMIGGFQPAAGANVKSHWV